MHQHGWISKTLYWIKKPCTKELSICFHSYEVLEQAELIYGGKENQGNNSGGWGRDYLGGT